MSKSFRRNCWEAMKCGREVGGRNVGALGICPAAVEERLDGINGGINGGRACWGVPATGCGTPSSAKFSSCIECPFYREVEVEEEGHFQVMEEILERLHAKAG